MPSNDLPSSGSNSNKGDRSARAHLTPATRQRLEQVFKHANKSLEKGDFAYAHDLFTQCVAEDPSSLAYLQHFRANLSKMHPNGGKKGSSFSGLLGGKSTFSKAAAKGDWLAAFTAACNVLKKHPADTNALCEMADACGEMSYTDPQLYYLKWAHDISPDDHQINRLSALALESISEFDQAINCWLRIQKHKPADEEASKAISRLSVEKTISDGGYNPALLSGNAADVVINRPGFIPELAISGKSSTQSDEPTTEEAAENEPEAPKLTRRQHEEQLRLLINETPQELAHYLTLADFYATQGRLQDAERLYRKAMKVGDGDHTEVLEKLEITYLQRMRERALEAGRRLHKHPSDDAEKTAEKTVLEANRAELEVFAARSERNPTDLLLKYELGLRYKRLSMHREAIKPFQAARDEPKRRSEVNLLLGECFQQISQHLLALRSYEDSIAACTDSDWTDLRKLATYRAGVLALGMKEIERAETHLTNLAGADFSYRDVGERLDKIAKIRDAT